MNRTLPLLIALAACESPADDVEDPAGEDTDEPVGPAGPSVVPIPVFLEEGDGDFVFTADTVISPSPGAEAVAGLLAEALRPSTGLPLPVGEGGEVVLKLTPGLDVPAEGYLLDVDASGVVIEAGDVPGLFYGTQTLRQLLPAEAFGRAVADVAWTVPAVHVEDAPRFGWRGLMIDVARHFFTVDDLKRQIDLLAMHKMNRLHVHLTDDQGWRIEIRSWPALTEIGGATEVGGGPGGFYTQEEYADIVAYAAERQIVVVPEIDFPGHANAAMASYGELNEDGTPADVYTGAPVLSTPLWLDGPPTLGFVQDVFAEVAAITPGPWLHVGGDEAVGVEDAKYDAFIGELQAIVAAEGKTMVGWDEIGGAPLTGDVIAQHWLDEENVAAAAAQGAKVLSSPAEHAYYDMIYDRDAEYGQIWAGAVTIQDAYAWDPVPEGLDESQVVGVEAALWTEYIDDVEKMDFMVWPRAVGLAELGWSPEETHEWRAFRSRLAADGLRLDQLGVGYNRRDEIEWLE